MKLALPLPANYGGWLASSKSRIQGGPQSTAQIPPLSIGQQSAAQLPAALISQVLSGLLPWFHLAILLTKPHNQEGGERL
jgi:hypothetical protein